MKKTATRLLLLMLLIFAVSPVSAHAAGKKAVYKAYTNWMNSKEATKYKKFCLVELDSDKIPELIGVYNRTGYPGINNYIICSYSGGKIVKRAFQDAAGTGGARITISYVPRKGKLVSCQGHSMSPVDDYIVYKWKGGQWRNAGQGTKNYISGKCTWGKKSMSKSKFDKKVSAKNSKPFFELTFISKAKMRKKLK